MQRSRSENAQNRCFCKESSKTIQPLSVEKLHEAEIQIVKFLQRKYFSDELQSLSTGKTVKGSSRLVSLDPFLDNNGIIRVGGRLNYAPIKFSRKYQILIPNNSDVAALLIRLLNYAPIKFSRKYQILIPHNSDVAALLIRLFSYNFRICGPT